MRIILLLFTLYLPTLGTANSGDRERLAREIIELTDEVVAQNLARFDQSLVDYRNDARVFRRIVNYLENWPITTGRVLARSVRCYPVFERELRAAGLPMDLKHLSVVESALRPWAVSHAGAGGMWQLMPGTARELGLTVNPELDERLDIEKGCAAGLAYLNIQYERYGDWALALAAYNSGPGNVNRAIRRSGRRNYWKLRRYLPRETRNYVPNFIAAAYLMTFHQQHHVQASKMDLDLQLTDFLTVYRQLSLHRVAMVTDLHPDVILELNPQYLRGYLPGYPGGHRLQLPQRVIPAMREYLRRHPATAYEETIALPWADPLLRHPTLKTDHHYTQYRTIASSRDTSLRQIAESHRIPIDRLARWSNVGELDTLGDYQELYYYQVSTFQRYNRTPRYVLPPRPPLPVATPPEILSQRKQVTLHKELAIHPPRPAPLSVTDRIRSWFR